MASMKMGAEPNPLELTGVAVAKSNADAACAADVHFDETVQKKGGGEGKVQGAGSASKCSLMWVVIVVLVLLLIAAVLIIVFVVVLDSDSSDDTTVTMSQTISFAAALNITQQETVKSTYATQLTSTFSSTASDWTVAISVARRADYVLSSTGSASDSSAFTAASTSSSSSFNTALSASLASAGVASTSISDYVATVGDAQPETDCDLNITAFSRRVTASDNSVFNAMSSWGDKPKTAKAQSMVATMYMQTNDMSMTNTDFSVNNVRRSGRRSVEEELDSRRENRRRSPCAGAPQPAPPPDSHIRTKSFMTVGGKFDLTMYMNVNSMLMKTNSFAMGNRRRKVASVTLDSDSFPANPKTRRRKVSTIAADNANTYNIYMSNNALSMQTTTFTMNVGQGSRRSSAELEIDEEARRSGNSISLTTMNINMYMCHNKMDMTDTVFTMNVGGADSDLAPTEIPSGGSDLSTTITQLLPLVLQGFAGGRRSTNPNAPAQTADFWNFISSAAAGKSTFTLNIYMYKNTMTMTATHFTFNVGGSRRSSTQSVDDEEVLRRHSNSDHFNDDETTEDDEEKTAQPETAEEDEEAVKPQPETSANQEETAEDVEEPMKVESTASSTFRRLLGLNRRSNRRVAKNKYLDGESKSMTNTVVTMDVGGSRRTESDRRLGNKQMSISKLNVKMFMYNNDMTMQDTTFAWNVG